MTEIILLLAEISWLMVGIVFIGCVSIASFLNEEDPESATVAASVVIAIMSGVYIWNNSWAEYYTMVISFGDYIPWLVVYAAIGLIWSFFKWASYVRKCATELICIVNKIKARWENRDRDNSASNERYITELVEAINVFCSGLTENNLRVSELMSEDNNSLTAEKILEKVNFQAGKKKSLIMSWIAYWPISMCSVILQEFVVGLVENIFRFSQGIYNKISKMMFANVLSSVIEEAKSKSTK